MTVRGQYIETGSSNVSKDLVIECLRKEELEVESEG